MKKRNESGRSMLEMLGVLVVVGVLSVAGIQGYRQAMVQHKANQIWNDVMMHAAVIRGIPDYDMTHTRQSDQALSFSSLGSVGAGGHVITSRLHGGTYQVWAAFSIQVHDVPKNVCEQVIQMRPDEIIGIAPNGKETTSNGHFVRSIYCDAADNKNDMRFYFDSPAICAAKCAPMYQSTKKYGNITNGFICRYFSTNSISCSAGQTAYQCSGNDINYGGGWNTANYATPVNVVCF